MSSFTFVPATKAGSKARIALTGTAGAGKAQPLDSLVLTPTGWRAMGELAVGDRVTSCGGGSSTVTGVYPKGEQLVYRVTFSDGATVESTGEHLWLTRTRLDRDAGRPGSVKTLDEIAASLTYRDRRNHSVPLVAPVEFDACDSALPIDPWLLGVLLGDGHLGKGVHLCNPEEPLREMVAGALPPGVHLTPIPNSGDMYVSRTATSGPNPLLDAVRSLELAGTHSTDKFIPNAYLYGSAKTRLAVLQGLLDTDGHTDGKAVEYSTSSPRLAEHVRFLVESLGGLATVKTRVPSYRYDGEKRLGALSYRLMLRVPGWLAPFRLERKAGAYRPKTKYQPLRLITAVEPVGTKAVQCIAVDAPDHLYVTEHCAVTHNTWSALEIANGLERGDGQLGLIDTDRGSARKYADVFAFQWLGMTAFDPDDLTKATIAAAEQNIGTLIVDTWSPFWSGADGMLDQVGRANSNFEGWRQMRPVERRMFDALLGYPGHVIVTMRVKTEYVVETNDKGRAEPKRIGLKPEQRDGTEHEFDVVLDLDDFGTVARVSKTRCPELAGKVFTRPGAALGETVQAWLDREAVGHLLNPQEVRAWALDETDVVVLRERYEALEAVGQLDAVVYDRAGALTGIGTLLTDRAREIRKEQELAARREQRETART